MSKLYNRLVGFIEVSHYCKIATWTVVLTLCVASWIAVVWGAYRLITSLQGKTSGTATVFDASLGNISERRGIMEQANKPSNPFRVGHEVAIQVGPTTLRFIIVSNGCVSEIPGEGLRQSWHTESEQDPANREGEPTNTKRHRHKTILDLLCDKGGQGFWSGSPAESQGASRGTITRGIERSFSTLAGAERRAEASGNAQSDRSTRTQSFGNKRIKIRLFGAFS